MILTLILLAIGAWMVGALVVGMYRRVSRAPCELCGLTESCPHTPCPTCGRRAGPYHQCERRSL